MRGVRGRIYRSKEMIRKSQNCVAYTGAGRLAESETPRGRSKEIGGWMVGAVLSRSSALRTIMEYGSSMGFHSPSIVSSTKAFGGGLAPVLEPREPSFHFGELEGSHWA